MSKVNLETTSSTIVSEKEIEKGPRLTELLRTKKAVEVDIGEEKYYQLSEIANYEKQITSFAKREVLRSFPLDERTDALIAEYEASHHSLCDEQKSAVHMFLTQRFGVLTGGPGTGKTTVLDCALYVIERLAVLNSVKQKISLISPTGKAARRMTEATSRNAQTVLKHIKFNPYTGKPTKVIISDYVFVDEASMIDTHTMYWLSKCLVPKCKLFLIGDTEQLPSIDKGSVLRDFIDCDYIPKVQLKKTFRQKEGSTLLKNIQIVRDGYTRPFVSGSDFCHFEELNNEFLALYFSEVKKRGLENVCILTPTRKAGIYASEKLNHKIQTTLNPDSPGLKAKVIRDERELTIPFRLGDPVMQLINRAEVANGEVGKIVNINPFTVEFTDCSIMYEPNELWQLDLAYAMSIHKSQGSEYQCVFVLCPNGSNVDRNMVYTAITRAKKQCYVFGSNEIIKESCSKVTSLERDTGLSFRLKGTVA